MPICADGGFNENFVAWVGVNFLLEGLDAIKHKREWTDAEEKFAEVLEQLSVRNLNKIYPEKEARWGLMSLDDLPVIELWERASKIAANKIDPFTLISDRDEEHPRGGCRFCALIETS